MWVMNSPIVSFSLRLAAYVLLSAGFFFGLLAVTILLFRRWRNTKLISWICNKLYLDLKVITIMTELPGVTHVTRRVIPVLAAFALGYLTAEIQRFDHTEMHRIQVDQSYGKSRYLVSVVNVEGLASGSQELFKICHGETDPLFEPGMRVDVIYEESSDMDGECKTFEGKHLGYKALVNQTTGELMKWTTPQQSEQ